MALLAGVSNIPQHEAIVYYHWLTIIRLLEVGIPWDVINDMTENQIYTVFGGVAGMKQKEQEQQARQQSSQMHMQI